MAKKTPLGKLPDGRPGTKKKQQEKQEKLEVPDIVLGEGTEGERRFKPATVTTFEQDLYLMDIFEDTGISGIVDNIDPMTMDLNEIGLSVIRTAYRSGKLFLLLGGLLVEDGVRWSEEVAEENAEYFANLSEQEDKNRLHGPVASVVLSFFMNALSSSTTSLKSSAQRKEAAEFLISVGQKLGEEPLSAVEPTVEELPDSESGTP